MRYLIVLPLLLASCAHQAPLKSPSQIVKENKQKADAAQRRAEREAKFAEKERLRIEAEKAAQQAPNATEVTVP